eukprot:6508213-Prymnesium_polylepis.2
MRGEQSPSSHVPMRAGQEAASSPTTRVMSRARMLHLIIHAVARCIALAAACFFIGKSSCECMRTMALA